MNTTNNISRVVNNTTNQQNQANSALRRSSKSIRNLLNIVSENSNQNTSVQESQTDHFDKEAFIALQNKENIFYYKDKKISSNLT